MRRYFELDVLDTLAVDAAAYRVVSYTESALEQLKPETRFQVLDRAIEGLDALRAQARKEHDAAQPASDPEGEL